MSFDPIDGSYQTFAILDDGAVTLGIEETFSKRMVKKQQMHWTPRGAHLLLQTRTKVLNNELDAVFRRWYPRFRSAA